MTRWVSLPRKPGRSADAPRLLFLRADANDAGARDFERTGGGAKRAGAVDMSWCWRSMPPVASTRTLRIAEAGYVAGSAIATSSLRFSRGRRRRSRYDGAVDRPALQVHAVKWSASRCDSANAFADAIAAAPRALFGGGTSIAGATTMACADGETRSWPHGA